VLQVVDQLEERSAGGDVEVESGVGAVVGDGNAGRGE
jgi:hypothetical protein